MIAPPRRGRKRRVLSGIDEASVTLRRLSRAELRTYVRALKPFNCAGAYALQGGGALIDIGVHALDRALWLMGNPKPVAVMGMTYANFGKRRDLATPRGLWDVDKFDVDDMGVALIRFEDGASLILRACWAAHIEGNIIGTRILGTEGGAHMSPLCIYRDMHGSMVDVSPTGLVPVDGHTAEIAHFVQCIRGKAECMVPVEQVLDVQAILDAIYLSSSTGREVRLDA